MTSIRRLRALGIEVTFVNYDQTSSQSSEFMLTMLSAIAQEESSNTSKRVKFGKKENAMNGRVPNLVYGYDKVPKDFFTLAINEEEANIVRRIYTMYIEDGYGTNRIAKLLNEQRVHTKRGCEWTQIGITRLLKNQLYIGRVINGKEEVEDFLSGRRVQKEEADWYVNTREELRIVSDDVYEKAQRLLTGRKDSFASKGGRETDTYLFSKLLYCSHCNSSYRRLVRVYRNIYIRWVCSKRNGNGVDACCNNVTVDEDLLLDKFCEYLYEIMNASNQRIQFIMKEIEKCYMELTKELLPEINYKEELNKCQKKKDKYITLYEHDIITIDELKKELDKIEVAMKEYEELLVFSEGFMDNERMLHIEQDLRELRVRILEDKYYLKEILDNRVFKLFIERIMVDENGLCKVYIKKA